MKMKKYQIMVSPKSDNTKVHDSKDICKVLLYFRYNVGSSLDCAIAPRVLRNSITYYVDEREKMGLLGVAYSGRDRNTGYKAKHYTADKSKWASNKPRLEEGCLWK